MVQLIIIVFLYNTLLKNAMCATERNS